MRAIRATTRSAISSPIRRPIKLSNGGGGTPTAPLRSASASNFGPQALKNFTVASATTVDVYIRSLFVVGADVTSAQLLFVGWALRANAGIENAASFDVMDAAIEYNGTAARVTFSGANSATVAPGANLLSDALASSALGGASAFTQGTTGFIRCRLRIATPATNKMPQCGGLRGTGSAGIKCDPTKVSFTNDVVSTGAYAYSMINGGVNGTDALADSAVLAPMFMGRHNAASVGFWGDSKTFGTSDTTVVATGALGMTRTLFPSASSTTGAKCGINLGCPSGVANDCLTAVAGSSVDSLTGLYQYITHAVVGYGTNATNFANQQLLHAQIRAGGITKIIQRSLTPRTTSTDSFATTVNQTLAANWGVGTTTETFESNLAALPATDADMTYYQSLGERSATSGAGYWLWGVNGTANYMTSDGLHERAVGYEANITTGNVTTQAGTVSGSLRSLVQAL